MISDLGPCVAPCWTRRVEDGDIQIRLWTGYSWVEFGCDAQFYPDAIERLSDELEWER